MPSRLATLRDERLSPGHIGKVISDIGEKANVKVHTDPKSGKVKHASAQDLRRSFGTRWTSRITPTELMVFMRHEAIQTTLKYYVGQNTEATAEPLYKAMPGNHLGNSILKVPTTEIIESSVNVDLIRR